MPAREGSLEKVPVRSDLGDETMHLSFVVVTYRRGELLRRCLQSIYAQEGLPRPYEVIVIDNGGDADLLSPSDPTIHLHCETPATNLGAAGGRNLGMELARGQYIVGLDDDAVWHSPHDVACLIVHLERDSRCGAVAVKSLAPDGSVIVAELPHPNKKAILGITEPLEVPYFYAMGVALRAEVFHRVGGYPPRFGIYMEELDFSLRLLDADYRILYDPSVAVIHHKSALGRPVQGERYWAQSALNKARVAWRLLPLPYPITILCVWSLATLIQTRSPRTMLGVWRDLWQERTLLRQERHPIRPATLRYLRSIGARLLY